ncbi:hypothetical protein NDU88_005835 [Pleurodeles waltl]|uniref:Uncharacterized protein n=1 Tax=Pleurodeles waltl TaxID=8319 RepID=A0AAV7VMW0_PLEWA|nr:hypothetical protein NDU88_005835 [Pleurodeles waltl]
MRPPALPKRLRVLRRSALRFLLCWAAAWVLVNTFLLVHKSVFSERCTDRKSRRILDRLVGIRALFRSNFENVVKVHLDAIN